MKEKILLITILNAILFFNSCGVEGTSEVKSDHSVTNNTTINGDTNKKSDVEVIASVAAELITDGVEAKRRKDSIRDANEERIWVYQIGDSYDDDNLVTQAYDKLKETEPDVYVFKKNRKIFYLIKGEGVSDRKVLEDSLSSLKKRITQRISFKDLSLECRKLPTNTYPIKYKLDGDRKKADCKTCE